MNKMECQIARKKLKDYVKGNIINPDEKKELEEHIKNCAVCKRELYLWQEVINKQKEISDMQDNLPQDLRDRIKYRVKQSQREASLPPAARKLHSMGKIWSSTKARLIVEILIVLISLVVLFKYMHGGKNLLVPFLILFGFIVLFTIMLKGRKEK
ncbi:MAG: zf-HC2 domain-containing protein [Candidatus Goldbacteria bacterium]|nr:zf-HC2 domain-containing protein [Candidatus Goldiibacteriota bacterium]